MSFRPDQRPEQAAITEYLQASLDAQSITPEAVTAMEKVKAVHGLGTPADTIVKQNVLLLMIGVDDSTSLNAKPEIIEKAGFGFFRRGVKTETRMVDARADDPKANAEGVRIGHNLILEAAKAVYHPRGSTEILVSTVSINGRVYNEYVPLLEAQELTRDNFLPDSATPLREAIVSHLKTQEAKAAELADGRKNVKCAYAVITDGMDSGSRHDITPETVGHVVTGMVASKRHLIAALSAVGTEEDKEEFKKELILMGFQPEWILPTNATREDIQKALGLFGVAIQQAARNMTVAGSFESLVDGGGFALLANTNKRK